MQEGFWINYDNGKRVEMPDHELWIREQKNAKTMGVPDSMIKEFGKFKVRADREKFLVWLMSKAPLMRVRGHGADITFEYFNRRNKEPVEAGMELAHAVGGMLSYLNFYNLATHESHAGTREELDELMDQGGYEAIMRAASNKFSRQSCKLMRELLAAAREIASSV